MNTIFSSIIYEAIMTEVYFFKVYHIFYFRARACIQSDENQSEFLNSYEIRVHDRNGLELEGQKKKRTLHELSLQTMTNSQKNNLFVYDGEFTLLLDNGKNLLLCKGNAHECTNNDSSQTNASLKPCE